MKYKYITENNLNNKQDYMYSEFGGKDFLTCFADSRKDFFGRVESLEIKGHHTRTELYCLRENLKHEKFCDCQEILDAYVKRFEVTKRIYSEYKEDWKAAKDASYEQLDLYLLLSECCIQAYQETTCLKYLSCALKINDTLLSVEGLLSVFECKWLENILKNV